MHFAYRDPLAEYVSGKPFSVVLAAYFTWRGKAEAMRSQGVLKIWFVWRLSAVFPLLPSSLIFTWHQIQITLASGEELRVWP